MRMACIGKPAIFLLVWLFAFFYGYAQPKADFAVSSSGGCAPLSVKCTDKSTGNPVAWEWRNSQNPSTVITLQQPEFVFYTPGIYYISLKVTDANGNTSSELTQTINVTGDPTVVFTADKTNGCTPLEVKFTDNSTTPFGNITSWEWDFGDGYTSTEKNPVHKYTLAGDFNVTLKVATANGGCIKTATKQQYIKTVAGADADFTYTIAPGCATPIKVNFINKSTATTNTYTWDFGDATANATDKNPLHDYIKGGTYKVVLKSKGGAGCESVIEKNIQLPTGVLAVAFNTPASICENEAVTFTNNFAYPPDNVLWNFGNGITSTNINAPAQTYAAGTYTVTLTATSGTCTGTYSKQIIVGSKVNAVINVSANGACKPPLAVTFSTTPAIASYSWDFGDGSLPSNQAQPTHTYNSQGTFNVKLKAANGNCTAEITTAVPISVNKPVVGVKNLPFKGCLPQTITLLHDINSATPIVSYEWTIGNNVFSSTAAQPTFTFTNAGKYDVRLKVKTQDGCEETFFLKDAIQVGNKPNANFNLLQNEICASELVKPVDASAGSPLDEWGWDFTGSGVYSVFGQAPQYKYTDTGTFFIKMYVESNGCRDTSTGKKIIIKPPVSLPDFDRDCQNFNAIKFINKSVYNPADASTAWLWDFGDGSPAVTTFEPAGFKTFPAVTTPTVFNVKLKVTTSTCSDEQTIPVTIYPSAPQLSAQANKKCANDTVSMAILNIDKSKIQSITWDFGDGSPTVNGGTDTVIKYAYKKPGSYTPVAKVVFSFAAACQLSVTLPATLIINGPVADFTFPPGTRCKDSTIVFTSTSKDDGVNAITQLQWNYGDSTSDATGIHTYNMAGKVYEKYIVSLTVTDALGCKSTKDSSVIITAPAADFVVTDSITCLQKQLQFINLSGGYKLLYEWNFGDGSPLSVDFSPQHAYTTSLPSFTVSLKVTDGNGCTAQAQKNNLIKLETPQAGFTLNDSLTLCPPLKAAFTLQAANYEKILWNFGNGEGISDKTDPEHFYNFPGTFLPTLTVTSKAGCTATVSKKVEILGANGELDITPIIGCVPIDVAFNLKPYGKIDNYVWNYDDGNVDTNKVVTLSHRYTDFGDFNPVVVITSDSSCKKIVRTKTIKMLGAKVNFKPDLKALCTENILNVTSNVRHNDPIKSYTWNFGDVGSYNNTSNQQNAAHAYLKPGVYDVSLKVVTDYGCTADSTMKQLIRVTQKPDVSINVPPDICQRDFVPFNAIINNQPDTLQFTKWQWNFGNGKTDTLQKPAPVLYSNAGSYTIQLIAQDKYGCKDTSTSSFNVKPGPNVDAGKDITTLPGNPVQLNATATADVTKWLWAAAAGLNAVNIANPVATVSNNQTYTVTVTNNLGCRAVDSVAITLLCGKEYYYLANTFTPDGNGVNDWFYPQSKSFVNVKTMRIFNRWGQLVFEKKDVPVNVPTAGWDGKMNGQPLSPDVYVYIIEVLCGNQVVPLKGNIMIAK
jgi:gliding motility-associated-like protein